MPAAGEISHWKWLSHFYLRTLWIGRRLWQMCWWVRMWGKGRAGMRFRRSFNDWEMELVGAFLHLLESHNPLNEAGDWVRWRLKKKHSFYSALRGSSSTTFPWKIIWGVEAPHQKRFGVGKILTGNNLRRRGFTIVDWCCLCQCSGEDVNHFLILCEGASWLLSFAIRSFGV